MMVKIIISKMTMVVETIMEELHTAKINGEDIKRKKRLITKKQNLIMKATVLTTDLTFLESFD